MDSADTGRKVYDFVPSNPTWLQPLGTPPNGTSYSLVLGRFKGDPHRLIVREQQEIRHVSALYVAERNPF